ncbi:MAG TPA: hypothetical protein VNO26_00805 [Candidatus Limnocylindria bacterium]|nr:hypothetical protein [Candidatus Limnocylindria bacterium]
MVVAGEKVEVAVGLDGRRRARRHAEVALEARIPRIGRAVRFVLELEVGEHRVDEAVGADAPVQEVAARADHAGPRRLRRELVGERPDRVRPALRNLLRPADRGGEAGAAQRLHQLHRAVPPREQALLARVELVVGTRQVARLHGRLVLFADQHDERARVRIDVEDLLELVGERRMVHPNEARVVGIAAYLLEELRPGDGHPDVPGLHAAAV